MEDSGEVQLGTVGWAEDTADSYADLGNDGDGHTLVQVTLFDGRDRATAPPNDPAVAEGRRIRAQISAPNFHTPKLGSVVLCARASGTSSWYVIHNPSPNPTDQFKGASRSLQDFGDDTDVVIRGRSVTLQSADGKWVGMGPDTGIQMGDDAGNGVQIKDGKITVFVADAGDVKSMIGMSKNSVQIVQKGATVVSISLGAGKFKVLANSTALISGNVALGAGASPAAPVQYGPPPYGIPSTSVFVQP